MTTKNEEQVMQDSPKGDAEQAPPEVDKPVTAAQLQQIVEAQNLTIRNLDAQVRGLHSGVNKALDGIRADSLNDRASQAQNELTQQFEKTLEEVPEEQRPAMRLMWQNQQQMVQTRQPQPVVTNEPQQQVDMAAIRRGTEAWVRDFGVDPRDSNVDYNALVDPTLTEDQRRRAFVISLRKAVDSQKLAPAAQATPASASDHNPSTETGPRQPTAMNSVDDVRDAFISGQIPQEEYRTRMAAYGVQI